MATRGALDSLRAVVDTLVVRDAVAYQTLQDIHHEIQDQRDILLSSRASAGTSTHELLDEMTRLEGRLEEVSGRFTRVQSRTEPKPSSGPDPAQVFDQATQDLTQGRYPLALQNFREYLRLAPGGELADNAQYGIGECFFAQSRFDSAAIEYARVETVAPQGDKVPAALYKLALSQDKLGRSDASRQTLESLVQRFPLSGEAQLARERLGKKSR